MQIFWRLSAVLVLSCVALAACVAQVADQAAPSAKGVWLGTLVTGGPKLRIQFHLQMDGPASCTLDSLDQGANGIPCSNLVVTGASVSLEIPAVHGSYKGTISADGKTLTGTFTQGADLPLVLEKQAAAVVPVAAASTVPGMDAAMAPVGVGELRAVLEKDLAGAMKSGALAAGTHGGVTVGVVLKGQRLVMAFGEGKPDGVYEIGSITKTFTATVLAQMVAKKKVRLDEPVRELLPAGTVAKPASGLEITLLDLSDQHSGLARMPDNFHPADKTNPYADYDVEALYAYMANTGVARSADAPFGYSNRVWVCWARRWRTVRV